MKRAALFIALSFAGLSALSIYTHRVRWTECRTAFTPLHCFMLLTAY